MRRIRKDKKPPVLFICEWCNQERGKKSKETKKRFCSRKCMYLWRSKEIKNGNISLKNHRKFGKGENNPNWKGGVTSLNELLRKTEEYKKWRTAVYKRDNYTCVWCGHKGGELNADHIKQFALYPKLRLEISNGRTLCIPCHRTEHSQAERS